MATVPSQRTWATLDVVTAVMLNGNVRDAVNFFISGRPLALLRQTAAQAITTATYTSVLFDTEDLDRDAGHSTVTNTSRYTAQTAGWYWVAGIGTLVADASAVRNIRLAVNGTTLPASQVTALGTASTAFGGAVARLVSLSVNDYVELQVQHNKGSNLNTSVVAEAASQMSVMWAGA